MLEFVFDGVDGARIEQVAQLLLAEELGEELAVEGEGGGATLGVRLIASYMYVAT